MALMFQEAPPSAKRILRRTNLSSPARRSVVMNLPMT